MRNKRHLLIGIGIALVLALGASACGTSEDSTAGQGPSTTGRAAPARPSERIERVRLDAEEGFGFLSPFAYRAGGRGLVRMLLMFDTLIWLDAEGEFQPLLAEQWAPSADGTEWRFTLRQDARWHNGTPVTADDVVFTFQYLQQGPGKVARVRPAYPVKAVAEGPGTVVLRVDQPLATFESIVGGVPIIPRSVWEKVTDPAKYRESDGLMGSGPYRLEASDEETGAYLFVANDDYFLGPPLVRRVEFVPAPNQILALRRGEIDVAQLGIGDESLPDEAFAPFESERYGRVTNPGLWNRTIFFGLTQGFPYNDVRFRQAVAYAVDRPDLLKRILFGRGTIGSLGGLVPAAPTVPADLATYDHNPARAAALLDEIGLRDANGDGVRDMPDGSPFAPEMITNNRFNPKTAELVKEYLRAVGINLKVVALDTATADSVGAEGKYQMALVGHGFGSADTDRLRSAFSVQSTEKSFMRVYGYDNPRFTQLAAEQLVTVDEKRRSEISQELQRMVAADAITISLYVTERMMLFDRNVYEGWYFTPGDLQVNYKGVFMGSGFTQ